MAIINYVELISRTPDLFEREVLPTKSLLVKQGTLAKKLFYLETGGCRGWFTTAEGKEVTLNFGFEGSFVSSMETLLAGEPSWYNVETLESTVVYSVSLRQFRALRATSPEWQAGYLAYVEQRLLHYQQLFMAHLKDRPATRYRALLAQHPDLMQRVPQQYLASFLGITPVSLSRIRHRK